MLGPIAVATGWLFWITSVPKTVTVVWRTNAEKTLLGKFARVTLATVTCAFVSPFWLLVLWVKGGLAGMQRVIGRARNEGWCVYCRGGDRVKTAGATQQSSLEHTGGGASRRSGDEREDAVMVVLNKTEGGE